MPPTAPPAKETAATLRRLAGACAFAVAGMILAAPALAQVETRATYDLTLRGLRAATLTVSAQETRSAYGARAALQSAGLLRMIKSLSFDTSADGRVENGRFRPARYTENVDLGSRKSSAELAFVNGVPEVRRAEPARPPRDRDVAPETQGGTIDPLTAIFIGLRDQPRATLCTTDSFLFDGRRRSRVVLSNPQANGREVTCAGLYQRIAGFSEREMAEKTDFPFRITYAPGADGLMQAREVRLETLYGPAVLTRR